MENKNTLDHLLKIESEAAALVNDAQAESSKRIHEAAEKCRNEYDEYFKAEAEKVMANLKLEEEEIKKQYQMALDEYTKEISSIAPDMENFKLSFNKFINEGL